MAPPAARTSSRSVTAPQPSLQAGTGRRTRRTGSETPSAPPPPSTRSRRARGTRRHPVRPDRRHALVAARGIELVAGQHRVRHAGEDGLDLVTRPDPAADTLDHLAQGRPHLDLTDPGRATSPTTVATVHPGDSGVPSDRCHSGPRARTWVTVASVSTLFTTVGFDAGIVSTTPAGEALQPVVGTVANRPWMYGGTLLVGGASPRSPATTRSPPRTGRHRVPGPPGW